MDKTTKFYDQVPFSTHAYTHIRAVDPKELPTSKLTRNYKISNAFTST